MNNIFKDMNSIFLHTFFYKKLAIRNEYWTGQSEIKRLLNRDKTKFLQIPRT